MVAAAQLSTVAWDALSSRLQASGLQQQPGLLTGLLRTADTMAAVAADVALLPLADTSGPSCGVASLGLYCAAVVTEAAAASPAAAQDLAAVQTPAAAWSWVQQYAAEHPASAAALAHLASWLPAEREWVAALLQQSAAVQLSRASAVPTVAAGWGTCSFLRPPAAAGSASLTVLLVAPRAECATLASLPQAELVAAVAQAAAGAQLEWGPLEVRQTLASRRGCQLLAVDGMQAAPEEVWRALLGAIAACCPASAVVVPVDGWRR